MTTQNRGIVKIAQGKAIFTEVPLPKLRDDTLLIKTIAVAINPTDWQTVDEAPKTPQTRLLLGVDGAGIVVEVGSKVPGNFKKGDRIAGGSHGGTLFSAVIEQE
jgi:NADPH:quinone reductase-like Zn-dependent oxidoreductase